MKNSNGYWIAIGVGIGSSLAGATGDWSWIAVGVGLGVSLGIAMNDLATWVAFGIAFGAIMIAISNNKLRDQDETEK